jgi:hypothetical protein
LPAVEGETGIDRIIAFLVAELRTGSKDPSVREANRRALAYWRGREALLRKHLAGPRARAALRADENAPIGA